MNEEPEFTRYRSSNLLYFRVSIPEVDNTVDHANLRILLDPRGTEIDKRRHSVRVYESTKNDRRFIGEKLLPIFSSDIDDDFGPRWIEVEATELANDRFDHENTTELVLELIFEGYETGSRPLESPKILEAALNVFTTTFKDENRSLIRRKRRTNPEHLMSLHKGRRTECRGENKKCCRHEMIVIFKDLKGFEFIVQPKNFDAGYCKGRCPPRYNPAHHHALLQSLIWKEDRRKAPRPCCAPSKLDELEILYFDENDPTKLKISSWKNMKVLECACS